jgi:hypothetical protein
MNITAFAAAVANTNASAGIGAFNFFNYNKNTSNNIPINSDINNIKRIMCTHNNNNFENKSISSNDLKESINLHQIGTNLSDLSVCWHKMNADSCKNCNETLYKGKYLIT